MRLGVPSYLPPIALPLVSWMRRHVATVAARYGDTSLDELWDDAVSALLRAAVYHNADTGAFGPYARTCIHRACARTVHVGQRRGPWRGQGQHQPRLARPSDSLHQFDEQDTPHVGSPSHHQTTRPVPPELTSPSAEAEAIAREAVRRAWILREHAELASSRGDCDTTTRLLEAAAAATTVARAARCRPRIMPSARA